MIIFDKLTFILILKLLARQLSLTSLVMPRGSSSSSHLEFTTEDFLKVLSDDAVQQKLCEILSNSIKLIIQEMFQPLEKQIKNDLGAVCVTIQSPQLKLDERAEQQRNLQAVNITLSEKLTKEHECREELEQYSRRENLFCGILATLAERTVADQGEHQLIAESSAVTTDKVISFCNNVLHTNISASDISIAHRCKLRRGSNCPPVLVRFVRRSICDDVFRAKAHLKTFNASRPSRERSFINKDLTKTNRKLLSAARKTVSDNLLDSAWSSNCHVYMKALPPEGKRYAITS